MSRKIEDLTPECQAVFREFEGKMFKAGLPFLTTCTYRSQQEQDELWAQGRTKPGRKVTWTTKSRHTQRTAFDIALCKNGKSPHWDVKADVNDNDIPDYKEAGRIGESVGLTWGGMWSPPDYCHFQLD